MKRNLLIKGKVVDFDTGQVIHEIKTTDFDNFDELFTKPMRKKLR